MKDARRSRERNVHIRGIESLVNGFRLTEITASGHRHVVEPVTVKGEGPDGRRPLKTIRAQVLPRELALPSVG